MIFKMHKQKKKSYLTDGANLIAMISHMATIDCRAETIEDISFETQISEKIISHLLYTYNEFFVSVNPTESRPFNGDEPLFVLHLRLGISRGNDEDFLPLSNDQISILINIVQHSMDIEHQRKNSSIKNWITMIAALIAAIAAILSAIIAVSNK
jgi:hypothetical protein